MHGTSQAVPVLIQTIPSWRKHWKNGRLELFSRLLPRIYQITEEINRRFQNEIQAKYPGNFDKVKSMAIIFDGQVKMANLAIASRIFRKWCGKTSHRDFEKSGIKRFLRDDAGEVQQQDKRHHPEKIPASWKSKTGSMGYR